MRHALQLVGLLAACLACGWAADQKNTPKNGPNGLAARSGPGKAALPRNGGGPGGRAQLGPPLSNPASQAARLYRATPEERERALEKVPPKQQEQIRKQLETFDAMPKVQQEVLIRRAERLASLPAEQQAAFRQQMAALGKLPQERKRAIGRALRTLEPMPGDQRQRILNSQEFKDRFSPEEQKIISDLSAVMLPPM